jgi:hypothetical protein
MKMKSLFSMALLVAFRAFAQDAPPPVITSIAPTSGPSSGGTIVTITGSNLDTAITCALPCPPTVTFGSITVPVSEESSQRLVVVTPAHAPGTVDVTVHVPGRESSRNPGAFTFTPRGQDAYEQVLFPVYIDGTVNGAHGSQWTASLWIRNSGSEAVTLAPWPCLAEVCPPVFPLTTTLGSGASIHNLPAQFTAPSANPARLLYVGRSGASEVDFGLRVRDISRDDENFGTEIPVVREAELLTQTSNLLDVPMTGEFRVLLRFYELAYTTSGFDVSVYPQTAESTASPIHSFTIAPATSQQGDFRTQPAYAQFDLTELLNLDDRQWPSAVRVEIRPQTPGSRYWAFASITNNDTQLVTTVTPQ